MSVDNAWQPVLSKEWQNRWVHSTCKSDVLVGLFDYHVRLGLIDPNTIARISATEWLHFSTTPFKLTINPGRRDRGVAGTPHPAPAHVIPFKDGVPCFCCADVLAYQWPEERGIWLDGAMPMVILPNIFPLFQNHFTLVSADHRPQRIDLNAIHHVTKQLPTAWVVQNDADAGATNPWHFHIQLFFEPDLPLERYGNRQSLSDSVALIDHPALILKVSNPDIANQVASGYLGLGDTRRLNVLARGNITYLVLRDIRFRTSLYATGQPGFPEPAGMIAAPSEAAANGWRESPDRYHQLMTDIRPDDDQTEAFLVGIRSV